MERSVKKLSKILAVKEVSKFVYLIKFL